MQFIKATMDNLSAIFDLVQQSISNLYSHYYPPKAVEFFQELHSKDNIIKDINSGNVYVLINEGKIVATSSHEHNHITRVFVSMEERNKGYGNYVMNKMEEILKSSYEQVGLHSSLTAVIFYENQGYKTIKHSILNLENEDVLMFVEMKKNI